MEIMEKSMGRADFLAVEEFVICPPLVDEMYA